MPRLPVQTRLACLLAASFSLAPSAYAQSAADAAAAAAHQAEILQRQNQERIQRDIDTAKPRDRSAPGIDTGALMPKVDASAAGPACHQVHAIEIAGAQHLSPAVRAGITQQFANRCLGAAEIEQILGTITKDYIERGLITTRAYLPSQDLKSGKLDIVVLEGKLEKIELDEGARRSINPWNVFPAPGGLLNLRDFEQGIDQVNKLSSNNATIDIQPGQAAGASRVVIHNDPHTPFHASLSADNQGSESTGKNEIGASISSDHLFGLNELLLFTFRRAQPNDGANKGSESRSLSLIVPFGYSTVSYTGSRSSYVSTIAAPSGDPMQFRGRSDSDSVKVERLVYRDQTTRESLSVGVTSKDSKNYLAGEYLGVSSRKLTVLDIGSSTSTPVLGGALTLDAGYSAGLRSAGALEDPAGLAKDAPRAQFGKYTFGLNYMRPFQVAGLDALFSSQVTSQYARHTLYGSEQILIGGLYSVRGFVNHTLSGDHGLYARNELSLRPVLHLGGQVLPLRLYAGLDVGRVRNRVADVPEGTLAGAALGFTLSWKGMSLDVSNSRQLSAPAFLGREAAQTWVRLSVDV